MYVEHLFEGKVMTADLIELKEEIYGNLMARYEDLVASGMDAAQALEEAKQSISSVDELLPGEGSREADSSDQSGATSADEDMKGPSAPLLPQLETVTTKASTTVKAHKKRIRRCCAGVRCHGNLCLHARGPADSDESPRERRDGELRPV